MPVHGDAGSHGASLHRLGLPERPERLYKLRDQPGFADPVCWHKLHRHQKGIARRHKAGGNKKQPLPPTMLINFKWWLDTYPPGQESQYAALWAMCLVAFFGYFRKSNVATKTTSPFSDGKCIRYCDVRVDAAQYALAITPPVRRGPDGRGSGATRPPPRPGGGVGRPHQQ